MKALIILTLINFSSVAKAETILSLATKQAVSQQSSVTATQKTSQDVLTSSMGVVLQGVYFNVVVGIGLFQDASGIATIGYRFK